MTPWSMPFGAFFCVLTPTVTLKNMCGSSQLVMKVLFFIYFDFWCRATNLPQYQQAKPINQARR